MRAFFRKLLFALLLIPATMSAQTTTSPGGALRFDGATTYLQVASNASLALSNRLTFEAWVNPSVQPTGNGAIISRGDGGTGTLTDYIVELQSSGSALKLAFFAVGNWDYSTGTLPTNAWSHVAVTFDGTNKQFFINGVLNSTAPRSGTLYSSGLPLNIGRQGSVCGCNLYKGLMDEVRVWNTVRTTNQIYQNFKQTLLGTEAGLAAYYKFDYITGAAARDSSTNANTALLVNRPLPVPSTAPFAPVTLALNGPNPLNADCHVPFVDPGAALQAPPLGVAASTYTSMVVKADQTLEGWGVNIYQGLLNLPATNVLAVGLGVGNELALRADGSLVASGDNSYGETNIPANATNVVAIAGGFLFNLALKADGTLVAWGFNHSGQTNIPPTATNVVAIAAAETSGAAVRADGTVIAWGDNSSGQTNIPANATNVVAISSEADSFTFLALKADGTVVAWGDNSYGQANIPANATNVVAIAEGGSASLVLRADGSLVVWGDNSLGQANIPASATNVVAIAAGEFHFLALRADGTVIAWGYNAYGQTNVPPDVNSLPASATGTVNTSVFGQYTVTYTVTNSAGVVVTTNRTVIVADFTPPRITLLGANPMILALGRAFVDPGATAYDQCAGDLTGSIVVSGTVNTNVPGLYQRTYTVVDPSGNSRTTVRSVLVQPSLLTTLGSNPFTNQCHVPYVDPGFAFQATPLGISAGGNLSSAIKADRTVVSWGTTNYGLLQVPSTATNVVALAVGGNDELALRADGQVIAWGQNTVGQTNVPANATNIVAIAAGLAFNLAVTTNGTVIAWGDNTHGQTNVPASATNAVAIAAGLYHGIASRADGTLVAWGDNTHGQTNVPASATNVVALAAGGQFSLALRADGSIIAWGDNSAGETTVPPNATNVVAIAAGGASSYALRADGSVVAWGYSLDDVTNIPATATNVVAIAAGTFYALALRADGVIIAWGSGAASLPPNLDVPGGATFTNSTVNVNVPGTYSVTCTGSYQGNSITNTRVVVVADTLPPALTLLGANPMMLFAGNPFVDPGVTAIDACAGDLSASIVASGAVNTSVPGRYQRTYTVTDPSGNSRTAVRSVLVLPSPTLTINGANPLTNQCHTPFVDPGAAVQAFPLQIGAGGYDSLVVKADNTVEVWGDNTYHQTNVPPSATNVVAAACGDYHCLALRGDGTVVAWGGNGSGETNVPANATNVVAISAGGTLAGSSLALKADGTLVAWGDNTYGLTNIPAAATNVVAIASGQANNVALRADGTLVVWGDDSFGQTNIPIGATNIVAVAAEALDIVALRADGTVLVWGDDSYGQTNVAANATNVVAIAAGPGSGGCLALRADGSLVAWGFDYDGETNIPAGATNVVAIAGGDQHFLALRADGTIFGWGLGTSDQTNVPANVNLVNVPVTTNGTVNANTPGSYSVTYTANYEGSSITNTRVVVVADTLPPALTLLGANPFQLVAGTPFVDPGATAIDACAGDLSAGIHVTGTVNSAVPGSYTLTYAVTDPSGNTATTNRTVLVLAAPSLSGYAASLVATNAGTATVTAQLSANVNPNGSPTSAYFQYGLNTSYLGSTAAVNLPAVYGATNVNAAVPNLSRGVVYHWRAVGSNSLGVTYGPDEILPVNGLYIAGDLNGDGVVSGSELNTVLSNYYATSPWLYITNVAGLGQSNVTFALSNSFEGAYSVQVSTDLLNWVYLGPALPLYEFTDTNAPAATNRYYRLRWP